MVPESLKSIKSRVECRHFIEIDAGIVNNEKIRVGDKIDFNLTNKNGNL